MGKKTKIDWCDSTWNPVTGCLHGCEYCYARKIAERFGSKQMPIFVDYPALDEPVRCADTYAYMRDAGISAGVIQPYPFDFTPTFHRYKLDEPQHWKKPRNIFVCSMADLFGDWVPDEWIAEVFRACEAAPQHRYLFLTKNPDRYIRLYANGIMPKDVKSFNKWYGCTVTKPDDDFFYSNVYGNGINHNGFLSIEPILEDFGHCGVDFDECGIRWVIIGAETGNRTGKVLPERRWIDNVVAACDEQKIPIFMKESLRELMGSDFRQEFPWEV